MEGLVLHPADFARQCVSLYQELANWTVKRYRTRMWMKAALLLQGNYPMMLPSSWKNLGGLVVSVDLICWLRSMLAQVISRNGPSMMIRGWPDLLVTLQQLCTTAMSCVCMTSHLSSICHCMRMLILPVNLTSSQRQDLFSFSKVLILLHCYLGMSRDIVQ